MTDNPHQLIMKNDWTNSTQTIYRPSVPTSKVKIAVYHSAIWEPFMHYISL